MREDICSIPVNDLFEPKRGCPICRMRDMLDARMVEYVTGAAMMEPDVRVETNRLGFCGAHLDKMCAQGPRLSVALLLESRLQHLENERFGGKNDLEGGAKGGEKTKTFRGSRHEQQTGETCFLCDGIHRNMEHIMENAAVLWAREEEFRRLFSEQECVCLLHAEPLSRAASRVLPKKQAAAFVQEVQRLSGGYLHGVLGDVSHFCKMFDYRSKGMDWGNSRDSIERAIALLSGRMGLADPPEEPK